MMLIDKMLLTNDCKLSCISSETLKYDMRKSMCRATPGDSTDLGSHKSGFVGKTKDYAGRDAQVGCRANARPPLSRYL